VSERHAESIAERWDSSERKNGAITYWVRHEDYIQVISRRQGQSEVVLEVQHPLRHLLFP
jgi:hypothetical protein